MKKLIVVLASALLCTGCSANSVDMFGTGTSSGKVNSLYGNKQSYMLNNYDIKQVVQPYDLILSDQDFSGPDNATGVDDSSASVILNEQQVANDNSGSGASKSVQEASGIEEYDFIFPVDFAANPVFTDAVGPRTAPVTGASTNHGGTDIGCPTGSAIYAAADGTVTGAHGIVVAITNLGSKSVSFTGSAHIKGDTNSLSDSIALLEPCLAVGGTTINYTECDSANITSITLEDCSITDAYLTAADWSVNATVTTDGTSSSDYGDNVSINYSYESSTGCSYTSLKVLLLNNVGEVLGYGIGFVNDVPAGENITGTMYAIAAPHSLDSLADMAMFSCPTLE